ncbi:unnamed protein product [Symbiodinium sp. KB8]|nr:unnamed protein product [Symbiodinium sp. KB8]
MAAVAGHELLQLLGLEQCGDSMIADGVTSLKAVMEMTEDDMSRFEIEPLTAKLLKERQDLWKFLVQHQLWLCAEKLFMSGYDSMADVRAMGQEDMKACGLLPGHQSKLLRILEKEPKKVPDMAEPVATSSEPSDDTSAAPGLQISGPFLAEGEATEDDSSITQANLEARDDASGDDNVLPCVPWQTLQTRILLLPATTVSNMLRRLSCDLVLGIPVQETHQEEVVQRDGEVQIQETYQEEVEQLDGEELARDSSGNSTCGWPVRRQPSEDWLLVNEDLDFTSPGASDTPKKTGLAARLMGTAAKDENVIMLLGSTGSGKTCFIHTLAGWRQLTRGNCGCTGTVRHKRMMRFVILINCVTFQSERAHILRQMALPNLRQLGVETTTAEEKLDCAREEVYSRLQECFRDTDSNDECLDTISWMLQSVEKYKGGHLTRRFVDVYHPDWTSSVKIERMLSSARDGLRVKLMGGDCEVKATRDDMEELLQRQVETLKQEVSQMLRHAETRPEKSPAAFGKDWAEQVVLLRCKINFLDGIYMLEAPGLLQSSSNSLGKLLADEGIPCAADLHRCVAKILTWAEMFPDRGFQRGQEAQGLVQSYINKVGDKQLHEDVLAVEAASSQTGTFSDQLALLARLESICSSATLEGEMLGDTSGAAEAMRGLEASVTAHFRQVFQSGMESVDATVSAVLRDPRSSCASRDTLEPFRDLIAQLTDCKRRLEGADQDWTRQSCNLLEQQLPKLQMQDADAATGTCIKNLCETIYLVTETLPPKNREIFRQRFAHPVHADVTVGVKQLIQSLQHYDWLDDVTKTDDRLMAALQALEPLSRGMGMCAPERSMLNCPEQQSWTMWVVEVKIADTVRDRMTKHSSDSRKHLEESLLRFLSASPVERVVPQLGLEKWQIRKTWEDFRKLRDLGSVYPALENDQQSSLEELGHTWAEWVSGPVGSFSGKLEDLDGMIVQEVDQALCNIPMSLASVGHLRSGLAKSLSELKQQIIAAVAAAGNYEEKDRVLSMMQEWRAREFWTFLQHLPEVSELEKQVQNELQEVMDGLQKKVLDPLQRQAAQESLATLQLLTKLENTAFAQAKQALIRLQDLVAARNVEDDKDIQWHLESSTFKGLKKLLGPAPETDAAGLEADLFRQRLERIVDCVKKHLALAKSSLDAPEALAKELAKLRAANEDIGDLLEIHQELHLSRELQELQQQAAERAQKLIDQLKAYIEQKSYGLCLERSEELKHLFQHREASQILTRTQQSEAEMTIDKAAKCLEKVGVLTDEFLESLKAADPEKPPSSDLALELRQLQKGGCRDAAYESAVQRVNKELDTFLMAKKHNDEMQSKISSEENIRDICMQLDSLSKQPGFWQRGYDYLFGRTVTYWIDCHREYKYKRACLPKPPSKKKCLEHFLLQIPLSRGFFALSGKKRFRVFFGLGRNCSKPRLRHNKKRTNKRERPGLVSPKLLSSQLYRLQKNALFEWSGLSMFETHLKNISFVFLRYYRMI